MAVTQSSDSPTKNFATATPVDQNTADSLAKGNLEYTAGGTWAATGISQAPTQKTYFEFYPGDNNKQVGVNNNPSVSKFNNATYYTGSGVIAWQHNSYWNVGTNLTGKTGWTANNDVCQIAFDPANGKTWFGINNTWNDSGDPANGSNPSLTLAEGTTSGYQFFVSGNSSGTIKLNFGQDSTFGGTISAGNNPDGNGNGDFKYAPPTGFFALASIGQSTPAIEDGSAHHQATLYTGNGGSLSITQDGTAGDNVAKNSTFKPDLLWTKKRASGTGGHAWFDIVRTTSSGQFLRSDNTDAEDNEAGFASFDTKGFSWDGAGTEVDINANTSTFVAWQWLADNTTGSNNTDGVKSSDSSAITSTVSVNQTAGFSIVKWTGNATNSTIGHGLGATPKWVIVKNRSASGGWYVGHTDAGFNYEVRLDETGARAGSATIFNETAPTSSVFSVGTAAGTNGNTNNMIAYCWAEIPGFSKFGSYEGNNNANGTFIELGFKPAFFITKNIDATGAWLMFDLAREPFNLMDLPLEADDTKAEAASGGREFDFLSNGVKARGNSSYANSAHTFIYMAFAEHPFAGSTPATAR